LPEHFYVEVAVSRDGAIAGEQVVVIRGAMDDDAIHLLLEGLLDSTCRLVGFDEPRL
jgi:hypothetical protein